MPGCKECRRMGLDCGFKRESSTDVCPHKNYKKVPDLQHNFKSGDAFYFLNFSIEGLSAAKSYNLIHSREIICLRPLCPIF